MTRLEELIDIYQTLSDEKKLLVCMNESNKQILQEVNSPLTMPLANIEKMDSEYIQKGVEDIFMLVEPLAG